MKLPRYLQVAILVTTMAVLWSLFTDEGVPNAYEVTSASSPARPVKTITPDTKYERTNRINLFPLPQQIQDGGEKELNRAPQAPDTPPLPLVVLGAWWEKQQRIIVLTDGDKSWLVCQRCSIEGKIWIGSEAIRGWTLKAVEKKHLLFEWKLSQTEKRLELDDLKSEPLQ